MSISRQVICFKLVQDRWTACKCNFKDKTISIINMTGWLKRVIVLNFGSRECRDRWILKSTNLKNTLDTWNKSKSKSTNNHLTIWKQALTMCSKAYLSTNPSKGNNLQECLLRMTLLANNNLINKKRNFKTNLKPILCLCLNNCFRIN